MSNISGLLILSIEVFLDVNPKYLFILIERLLAFLHNRSDFFPDIVDGVGLNIVA